MGSFSNQANAEKPGDNPPQEETKQIDNAAGEENKEEGKSGFFLEVVVYFWIVPAFPCW